MTRIPDDELERHNKALALVRSPWKSDRYPNDVTWLVCSEACEEPQQLGAPPAVVAEHIPLRCISEALARAPDAFTELAELRKWARRTVDFLKLPESNIDLFDIMAAAKRLGIE